MNETLISVAIGQLMADPTQPRRKFDADEIARLAVSIAARGVLEPLRVRFDDSRDCYQIIVGERRYRAAKRAGLTHVPCIVVEGDSSESDTLADQIVENTLRSGLGTMDFCRSLAKLKTLKGGTSSALAAELGLKACDITRAEAILSLSPVMQQAVEDGRLCESAAYIVARVEDEHERQSLFEDLVSGRKSRDQAAAELSARKKPKSRKLFRLPLKLDGGLVLTLSGKQRPSAAALRAAVDRLVQAMETLGDDGDLAMLARRVSS